MPKKQNKTKKTTKNKVVRTVDRRIAELVARALSHADPFNPHATDSKFPDGAGGATRTIRLEEYIPVLTDAQGEFAFSVGAGVDTNMDQTAAVVDGEVTWNSADEFSARSGFDAVAHRYRVTSFGARFDPTAADDANGGVFFLFNDADRPVGVSECQHDKRVPAKKPWVLIGAPLGSDARAFADEGSNIMSYWTHLGAIGQGLAASTTVGYIHIVMHLEYTPQKGSIAQGFPLGNRGANEAATQSAISNAYNMLPDGSIEDYMSWFDQTYAYVAPMIAGVTATGASVGGYALGYYNSRNQRMIAGPNV